MLASPFAVENGWTAYNINVSNITAPFSPAGTSEVAIVQETEPMEEIFQDNTGENDEENIEGQEGEEYSEEIEEEAEVQQTTAEGREELVEEDVPPDPNVSLWELKLF